MKVLGRSVVVAGDVLLATVQQQLSGILNDLADHIDDPGGILSVLTANPAAGMAAEDIADLVAEVLRIGAEVYGPLPASQRQRLRSLMYQVIDPLPATGGGAFLDELARDNFVPQLEAISALAQELGGIGLERFFRLVELLLQRIGLKLLEDLAQAIQAAVEAVVELAEDVIEGLRQLGQRLIELVAEIAALIDEVAELFAEAADALLESLASLDTTTGRNRLKDGLVDAVVGGATDLLESNDIYKHWVPSDIKNSVESTMRGALRSALNVGVIDVVLDAVGEVASSLDDLVDDVRDLDPNEPLAPQLLELVLDRIEDAVEAAFGDDPHIDLEFDVSWQYEEPVFVGPAPWDWETRTRTASFTIDLRRIDIPLDDVLSVVRDVGRGLGALETAIEEAAEGLASAFAAEQQLQARETEKTGLQAEHETLKKRRAETAPGPRSIAILSPVPMQVIDRPTSVRVRIEGVPESIVEEGPDLPPRMLVLLNGAPVPVASFSVAPLDGGRLRPIDLPGFGGGFVFGVGLRPHPITGATLRGVGAIRPGATLRGTGGIDGTGAFGRTSLGRAGRASARAAFRERVVARAMARHAVGGGARPGGLPGGRDVVTPSDAVSGGGGKGRDLGFVFGASGLASIRGLGRSVPVAHLGELLFSERGGILMTRTFDPSQLSDGVNSLSVVVIDGQGQRTEATVSFLAAAAVAPDPTDKRPRLPGIRLPLPGNLRPLVIAGSRGLLPPKKQRRATVQKTAETLRTPRVDPLRRVREVSPKVAARLPERARGEPARPAGGEPRPPEPRTPPVSGPATKGDPPRPHDPKEGKRWS